jgi:hypothetical protein
MTHLSESEVLDRHRQSLGEAKRACLALKRHADPNLLELKGPDYMALKKNLEMLETSARQIAHFRSDSRWIRLGAIYGRARIQVQGLYGNRKWLLFGELASLFDRGLVHLAELDKQTGVVGRPILPQRQSEWMWMPQPGSIHRPRVLH